MILVMIMGRHRGLPESVDPAVKVPMLRGRWVEDFSVDSRSSKSPNAHPEVVVQEAKLDAQESVVESRV